LEEATSTSAGQKPNGPRDSWLILNAEAGVVETEAGLGCQSHDRTHNPDGSRFPYINQSLRGDHPLDFDLGPFADYKGRLRPDGHEGWQKR
jgi:hypothetical protein